MGTAWHVALVYNVKHDETRESSDREDEQSGLQNDGGATSVLTKRLVTSDDTYAEWDTFDTILAVKAALEQRHRVSLIEANEDAYVSLRDARPDIVFNIAEGLRGPSREAQLPAILELLGIPYTGSDPLTLGICLDKSRAKEILSFHGIPTPAFAVIDRRQQLTGLSFPLPAIVKPLYEGSSKGIMNSSVVRTKAELRSEVGRVLREYHQPALLEQFLPGREFTVALVGNPPDLRTLPIVEINLSALPPGVNPIWSYEAKWLWDTEEHRLDIHQCPAPVTPQLDREITRLCARAFEVLRCRDWCRIDVRLDETGKPHIIELNPLPGILPDPEEHSCFPEAARAAGIDYNAMINMVLDAALQRHGMA